MQRSDVFGSLKVNMYVGLKASVDFFHWSGESGSAGV
jgi:hypothetical protein